LLLPLAVGCASTTQASRGPRAAPVHGEWTEIGRSVEDRPLLARTLGAGSARVYLVAGIHGDERPAIENADRLEVLVATSLPQGVTVRLVRDVNPDGSAVGSRANARGVDLNRNWPARNFTPHASRGPAPLSEPEAAAMHADFLRFDPTLVIVLHAARSGPFVNYDGPARDLAHTFASAARAHDERWRVVADMGYPTPGSLGSWVGNDLGLPILTVELQRAESAESLWPGLRAGIVAALDSSGAFRVE
ncbi:MAG: DUF2817 domain-containing protein, partial [Planctomycetota bacterium]|nr:DUF2817 domain-containing protein [Planctomycetota bacterium]